MKSIAKLVAFGLFAASTLAANAIPINGSISGNDDSSTFNNTLGTISFGATGNVASTPLGATFTPYFNTVGFPLTFNTMQPFFYSTTLGGTLTLPGSTATTGGVSVFTLVENNETLTYYVTSDTTLALVGTLGAPPEIVGLTGSGYFTETGLINYDTTTANFTLTGSTINGSNFSFGGTAATVPTATTPEPSSLMLLGTGLFSAAGMVIRKRRSVV